MPRFPEWTAYALNCHRAFIEKLAAMGSWKEKELLGLPIEQAIEVLKPEDLSDRYFVGDTQTFTALKKGYQGNLHSLRASGSVLGAP